MKLNPLQNDRAAGVLVAMAAGDALGAGYEFGAPLPDGAEVSMKGGGPFGFAPAEWTDDTSMAIPIAQALLESASDGGTSSPAALTGVVRAWTAWAAEAKDVGVQTSSVIAAARRLALASGREVQAADFTVTTPIPLPPSPGACWELLTATPPCLSSGAGGCAAGRGCGRVT